MQEYYDKKKSGMTKIIEGDDLYPITIPRFYYRSC